VLSRTRLTRGNRRKGSRILLCSTPATQKIQLIDDFCFTPKSSRGEFPRAKSTMNRRSLWSQKCLHLRGLCLANHVITTRHAASCHRARARDRSRIFNRDVSRARQVGFTYLFPFDTAGYSGHSGPACLRCTLDIFSIVLTRLKEVLITIGSI